MAGVFSRRLGGCRGLSVERPLLRLPRDLHQLRRRIRQGLARKGLKDCRRIRRGSSRTGWNDRGHGRGRVNSHDDSRATATMRLGLERKPLINLRRDKRPSGWKSLVGALAQEFDNRRRRRLRGVGHTSPHPIERGILFGRLQPAQTRIVQAHGHLAR